MTAGNLRESNLADVGSTDHPRRHARDRHSSMMRHLRRAGLVAAVTTLGLLTACAKDAPLDTLEPAGPAANRIDGLWNFVFIIAAVIFFLFQGALVYTIVKYRRRKNEDGEEDDSFPPQTHGNFRVEVGWTIAPAIILVFVAVYTVSTVFALEERDDDTVPVDVIGQQWWWEYRYDADELIEAGLIPDQEYEREQIITAAEMMIPATRQMDLDISARDVIHSFWIPRLNGKRDAVPGRNSTLSMQADEPGEFLGNCAEFCGLSHSRMRMSVRAIPDDEFTEWAVGQLGVAERPADASALAVEGWETFRSVCSTCHLVDGGGAGEEGWGNEDLYDPVNVNQESGRAPDLTHFMNRPRYAGAIYDLYAADEQGYIPYPYDPETFQRNDLEAWLKNPPARKAMDPEARENPRTGDLILPRGMPDLGLNDQQVDALVEYLTTLQ